MLLVVCLVAVQSLLNLINDWNKEPEVHTAADDIDEEEIERLKKVSRRKVMDIGTISLVLLLGLMLLLAIGMPLGMASAILAVLVLVMKFEPMLLLDPTTFGDGLLTRKFGTGPLNILAQKNIWSSDGLCAHIGSTFYFHGCSAREIRYRKRYVCFTKCLALECSVELPL